FAIRVAAICPIVHAAGDGADGANKEACAFLTRERLGANDGLDTGSHVATGGIGGPPDGFHGEGSWRDAVFGDDAQPQVPARAGVEQERLAALGGAWKGRCGAKGGTAGDEDLVAEVEVKIVERRWKCISDLCGAQGVGVTVGRTGGSIGLVVEVEVQDGLGGGRDGEYAQDGCQSQ